MGVKVGVMLPVGVLVGVAVREPVAVGVMLPVAVAVLVAVREPVAVGVAVNVGVGVNVEETDTERFRKMTIVWEIAVPSIILTVAVPAARFLLINRSAGMV